MYKYLLLVFVVAVPFHGYAIDDLLAEEESLEPTHMFIGEPQVTLADESDEPDSGNWYEKLRWWKEAKWLYTIDIRNAIDQLDVLKEEYDARKQAIFSVLESYSAALPLKRQSAEHVIDGLIEDLIKRQEELAREQTRTQIRKDTTETTELEEHQRLLNELKSDFVDFNTLTQRLKQAFDMVAPKQVQDAKVFDQIALEAYESIESSLDDAKAHKSFDEVQNALENINALMAYVKGPLWVFVDRAWAKTQQLMPQITKRIADLEDKGVVVRPLTADEKTQMAQIEKERQERRARKAAERKAATTRLARPWWKKMFSAIGSFFSSLGSGIWYGIKQPFVWIGSFFSKAEPVKKVSPKNVSTKEPAKKEPPAKSEATPKATSSVKPAGTLQQQADQASHKKQQAPFIPTGMKPPALGDLPV